MTQKQIKRAFRAQPNPDVVELKKKLREAVANYMQSEGCSCCQGDDHKEHEAIIAKLLGVRKYSDGSWYNFGKYESKNK